MRRRKKAGGKAAKTQRRRTAEPRTTAKIAHQRKSSSVDIANRIGLIEHRLNEALEQQAATAEVLNVISSSPGQLEPVFQTILANATHICGAGFGTLYLRDGDPFRAAAFHNAPAFIEAARTGCSSRVPEYAWPSRGHETVAHVLDSTKREVYRRGDPFVVAEVHLGGYRTIVSCRWSRRTTRSMLSPSTGGKDARLPTSKSNWSKFCAQAVIAIESTRLLNELQQSFRQQTATLTCSRS